MLQEKVPKKASPACPHRSPTLRELRAPSPQHSGPAPSPRSVQFRTEIGDPKKQGGRFSVPAPALQPCDRRPLDQWRRTDSSRPRDMTLAAKRRARSGVFITVMTGIERIPNASILGTSPASTSSTTQASSRPSPRAP